jgi:hypothetical protein
MTAEAARQAALHADIARKYERQRDRQPVSIAAVRVGELQRLFQARYGQTLPDDDAGREDARIMAHHLARLPNAERRIPNWLDLHAPWMTPSEIRSLTAEAFTKRRKWKADRLAVRLNICDAERSRLAITTIGAVDADRAQRLARRRDRARQRKEESRRAKGAKPRVEYEANSLSRNEPWKTLSMSRASWYRAGKPQSVRQPTRETSPATA